MTAPTIVQLGGGQRFLPVYQSAARTGTPTPVQVNGAGKAIESLIVAVNMTGVTGGSSVVVSVVGVDPLSGATWNILSSASISATGLTLLKVGRTLPGSANAVAQDIVPPIFQVVPVHTGAGAMTYSVSVMVPEQ